MNILHTFSRSVHQFPNWILNAPQRRIFSKEGRGKERACSGELCHKLLLWPSFSAGWVCLLPPEKQEGPGSPSQPLTSSLKHLSTMGHPCFVSWDFLMIFSLEHKVSTVSGIGVCWKFCLLFFLSKGNAFWIPSYLFKWKVLLSSVETGYSFI